jgi:sugar phosphate isomerase/epimerase
MATTLVAHTGKLLTIAGPAMGSRGHRRMDWLYAHDFAIEVVPDPARLDRLAPLIWPYFQKGLPIRFNALLPDWEMGDAEPETARRALQWYMALVDVVSEFSDPVVTCRIGLTNGRGISGKNAIADLTALTDYAARRRVTIALANHRTGPTATPERHLLWARRSGAKLILDLGAALSANAARRMRLETYIDRAADRLVGVCLSDGIDPNGHRAPTDMTRLGPAIERLTQTPCSWWTLPLEHTREMRVTRRMALDYLDHLAESIYRQVANSS